ncbi:phosphatase domain-containing protein [Burkholderia stabilis]|uniref:Effector protein hopD2 n=1 Tax=Burkholderia stabilis TaxID=95485 RepID=A0AAJ5NDQ3_9BURK|nr:phosphatase [Burkholderia stabilis]VBB16539.1 Effector protein hopD2 [Burkholderia stabilis]
MTKIGNLHGSGTSVDGELKSEGIDIREAKRRPSFVENSGPHAGLSPFFQARRDSPNDENPARLPHVTSPPRKPSFAQPPRELNPILTFDYMPQPADQDGSAEYFRYFRTTNDLNALPADLNREGLGELRLSGSDTIATTEQIKRIASAANVPHPKHLYIVDLRQEPHAVADRYTLTLRGPKDWANVGLSHDEALQREAAWIDDLRGSEHLKIDSAEDFKTGTRPMRSVTLHRPEIVSEQELVELTGAKYARLTVTDHLRPDNDAVDRFVDIVRQMPPDAAMHVHCKGGRGRTTTFMVVYDMLRNARRVSADGIIDRQGGLGRYELKKIDGQNAVFRQDRLSFLYLFHQYAEQNPGGQPQTWSAWRASRADLTDDGR